MLNEFLHHNQHRHVHTSQHSREFTLKENLIIRTEFDHPHNPNRIQPSAFSNPEYMCFSELTTLLNKTKPTANPKHPISTPLRKPLRQVPLPPPARPPPPPPTLPKTVPPKLYQNLPDPSEPIQVDCYTLPRPQLPPKPSDLLKINDTSIDSSSYSSMILLQSSSNTTDSSTATMIIRNSPDEEEEPNNRKQMSKQILSPIMTSSRADLQRHNFQMLNESDMFTMNITNSLPFKRTQYQHRQRRLSFNDTLESLTEQTLTQKSFSNFNYELKQEEEESSESTSSLSSSLSSLVLQPPSPFKTSTYLPKQTPTKSNIKSSTLQKPRVTKKVSFMLREEALLSTSDYEDVDNVILRNDTCNSISSNSSTSSLCDLQHEKFIFANHDYFLNLHGHLEPSSSSSSASSCSSSSSTSSGYKSINMSTRISPTDLNVFIRSNQERLERLRQKRAELVMAKNTDKLNEVLDYAEMKRDRNENCSMMKDVSARLFQNLQNGKVNSPVVSRF